MTPFQAWIEHVLDGYRVIPGHFAVRTENVVLAADVSLTEAIAITTQLGFTPELRATGDALFVEDTFAVYKEVLRQERQKIEEMYEVIQALKDELGERHEKRRELAYERAELEEFRRRVRAEQRLRVANQDSDEIWRLKEELAAAKEELAEIEATAALAFACEVEHVPPGRRLPRTKYVRQAQEAAREMAEVLA